MMIKSRRVEVLMKEEKCRDGRRRRKRWKKPEMECWEDKELQRKSGGHRYGSPFLKRTWWEPRGKKRVMLRFVR